MKSSNFIYGAKGQYGHVKKEVLDQVEKKFNAGQVRFTYTEVHDFILDVTRPNWKKSYPTIEEARYEFRGQHTGMFTEQNMGYFARRMGLKPKNVLCRPNQWDSRHLVKISKGLYEFKPF